MSRLGIYTVAGVLTLAVAACAPAAPPSPTVASPKPAPTTAPAKPAEKAAPTTAPAKPAEKAAGKPAAKPTEKPAAKAEPKPAAKAAFDEKAVADFYRGKTIRIVTGSAAGGGFDFYARLVAKYMPEHMPGKPNIIVENSPPNLRTANSVYKSEAKDGTVIGTFAESQVLAQLLGAPGIEYDAAKFNWLGAAAQGRTACVARTDGEVKRIQDTLNGKELIVGTNAPGSNIHDIPAVMKAALGANFKLVPGYGGTSKLLLALEQKEIDAFCATYDSIARIAEAKLEGSDPEYKFLVITGTKTPDEKYLQGVPPTQSLAKTDESRQLLRAVEAPADMAKPYAVSPEVPADRVAALRQALMAAFKDPQMVADGKKAGQEVVPSSGEEVTQTVKDILSTPPAVVEKLKAAIK